MMEFLVHLERMVSLDQGVFLDQGVSLDWRVRKEMLEDHQVMINNYTLYYAKPPIFSPLCSIINGEHHESTSTINSANTKNALLQIAGNEVQWLVTTHSLFTDKGTYFEHIV